MKGLTIEEKAKRYDEAIKVAKDCFNFPNYGIVKVDVIFPELKESEGEESKKWILEYLYDGLRKSDIQFKDDFRTAIAWLEKQGEQRTADKVEPKFQNGQWIVWQNQCYKVNFLNGRGYELILQNGLITSIEYRAVDKSAHLWNIEDAKDGDVLIVPSIKGSEHSEQIFIFKEIKDRLHVKNAVEYYCRCMDNEFAVNKTGYMGTASERFYPATKEQRDTLLKAMADAGYEFDFDKKELKKNKVKL